MQNSIDEKISYINWSEEPLSSDVIIVKGNESTWIFDVGQTDEAYEEIMSIKGHKNIVLSHFHVDHIGNIKRLTEADGDNISLYVSKQTYKYTNKGIVVDKPLELCDGVKIRIIPIPSSHSKGCLALEINDEYAFLGDAIYPTYRDDKREYNSQLLKEQIELLESLSAGQFYLSHDCKPFVGKKVIVLFLKSIYEKRNVSENKILI